ncbi:MAG: glycine--tRNA ligase subunit beta [Gammaproteobacteria bacterium]|nr:glycine--tRNA ligase subunit beta [Gammaproteobacteria bacterium]
MSQNTATLLFELGTEELPPGALKALQQSLVERIREGLDRAELAHGTLTGYAAPRRLAVQVSELIIEQADRPFERRGPALTSAFDEAGQPTRAAEGFARSCGVSVDALEQLKTDEGAWLVHRGIEPGQATASLLPAIVEHALTQLPIPKRMRWGSETLEFVRPVHWVVLLLGNQVVPATFFGVTTDRNSQGHRFHHPDPIAITSAETYVEQLYAGHVMVDFAERRASIHQQVIAEGDRLGGQAMVDDGLLDEVTALVEWPVALSGSFAKDFLRVPAEALVSSMQEHQRYFPVQDQQGALLPHFITVANIDSRDPAQVVAGNERVIRPRLADAAFFWDQDRQQALADRLSALEQVVFQKSLGSVADKSQRVASLAEFLADSFGVSPVDAKRAGQLARADLVTEMVGEFPDLQGIMGRYYALESGEKPAVAAALDEGYQPRFSGDAIAPSALGQLLAVAERIDTLTGIFAIGKAPTGAKDPFALRRAALGLLRTLIEAEHDIDLTAQFKKAADSQPAEVNAPKQIPALIDFCIERLRALYHEQGFAAELFEAVHSVIDPASFSPLDFDRRLRACQAFAQLPAAASLAGANKRIRNLLRKAETDAASSIQTSVNADQFEQAAESELFEAVSTREASLASFIENAQYAEALALLAELKEPVDRFFDEVMVMADDPAIQKNRLALLHRLQQQFLAIADVSALTESG